MLLRWQAAVSRRATLRAVLAGLAGAAWSRGERPRRGVEPGAGHAGHGAIGDLTGGNRVVGAVDHARNGFDPLGDR